MCPYSLVRGPERGEYIVGIHFSLKTLVQALLRLLGEETKFSACFAFDSAGLWSKDPTGVIFYNLCLFNWLMLRMYQFEIFWLLVLYV